MAVRQTFYILDLYFDSKSKLKAFAKSILNKYPIGELLNVEDAEFIAELLKRHSEYNKKVGCGISAFTKRKGGQWNTDCFYIIRLDGSETDFSYIACIDNDTTNDQHNDFRSAARLAVKDQSTSYFAQYVRLVRDGEGKIVCEKTGERIFVKDAHVDHAPPMTFDRIIRDFITEQGVVLENVRFKKHGDGDTQVEFEDADLLQTLAEFHRSKALLRVVSQHANLTQKKKEF